MIKGEQFVQCTIIILHNRYGPATQVRWLQDPKPTTGGTSTPAMATNAGNNVAANKRPAPTTPTPL